MIRRPPRSTLSSSSAASDVYKRQEISTKSDDDTGDVKYHLGASSNREFDGNLVHVSLTDNPSHLEAVSYTHLRAHETGRNLVCRLLLEKKKQKKKKKHILAHTRISK